TISRGRTLSGAGSKIVSSSRNAHLSKSSATGSWRAGLDPGESWDVSIAVSVPEDALPKVEKIILKAGPRDMSPKR
ncbi:MAG: hypothetical protein ACE5LQ_04120, partial [Candidatus Bipolaricaulia bacterium]